MTKEEAKHLSEVLKAYSEGKKIQYRTLSGEGCTDWEDTDYISSYDAITEYRIKPEPQLRPYKTSEEFMKDMFSHGMFLKGPADQYCLPILVEGGIHKGAVVGSNDPSFFTFEEIMNFYTWADGTPCGVTEEV